MNNLEIQSQREYYNDRWQKQNFLHPLKRARCAAILQAFAECKLQNPRILDLGCGSGWLAGILGNFGPTVGVELSDIAIETAALANPQVEYICADFFDWDFDFAIGQDVYFSLIFLTSLVASSASI